MRQRISVRLSGEEVSLAFVRKISSAFVRENFLWLLRPETTGGGGVLPGPPLPAKTPSPPRPPLPLPLPHRCTVGWIPLSRVQDKFAFSVVWRMSKEGEILSEWFGKSVIHNYCRFFLHSLGAQGHARAVRIHADGMPLLFDGPQPRFVLGRGECIVHAASPHLQRGNVLESARRKNTVPG